jgi:hypothetical protein
LNALLVRVGGVPDFGRLELLLRQSQASARVVLQRVVG